MKYAVIKEEFVDNLIVCEPEQVPEMETALQAQLIDAVPLGLSIGDMRVDGNWTRNIDGVQTILTERATYEELEQALFEIQEALNGGDGSDQGTAE